ncbi:MAG TPA: hypothetical protein VL793_00845 [Patescibacteria group bacterium]|nr:hypothetical protein [Patescibacteria group bacterium]
MNYASGAGHSRSALKVFGVRRCCVAFQITAALNGATAALSDTQARSAGRARCAANATASRAFLLILLLCLAGCSRPLTEDALIVTQAPRDARSTVREHLLDFRYPPGTRIVIAQGAEYRDICVLSTGLVAAGEPVVSHDGRRIVFAGKSSSRADWQIYENTAHGGQPRRLTAAQGGAANPALLADGTLLYVSPVPVAQNEKPRVTTSLFAQTPGARPRQLTFGICVSEPTVLSDGRILFVSAGANKTPSGSALYTINNDGTEITAYAGQHDPPAWIRRPRELEDGRIVFLAGNQPAAPTDAEFVLSARPFKSRSKLFPNRDTRVYSVQSARIGDWLVCAQMEPGSGDLTGTFAVFQVGPLNANFGQPQLNSAGWNSIEAIPAAGSRRTMGRLSNVDLAHQTGQILCLNVNDSTFATMDDSGCSQAKRVRIFTREASRGESLLGEIEVQSDGSFMAEVPADTPLGFETLNEQGTVLRREAPLIWVRPGENRSCIGCHEPHNHSSGNVRPLAVRVPVHRLVGVPNEVAQKSR